MLIYTCREPGVNVDSGPESSPDPLSIIAPSAIPKSSTASYMPLINIPEPPFHAIREVERLNALFDQEVDTYNAKLVLTTQRSHTLTYQYLSKSNVIAKFTQVRQQKMDIYESWHIDSHADVGNNSDFAPNSVNNDISLQL